MRFTATITDNGIRLLERSLLPACLKTGKKIYLLLSNEATHLVQDEHEGNGMIVTAMIRRTMLFEEDNFICRSKADNMICIHLSLDVLLKAMRSASAHDAGTLDIALRHRPLKTSQNGAAVPLLELQWRNDCISISQEIPIEKPCSAVEVERIHGLCLGGATCGFYADIQPEAKSFMGILENIRNFTKKAVVHITMDGDFHVVSEAGLSKVGVAFPSFDVFLTDGSPTQNARSTQQVASMEERLQEATDQHRAMSMQLEVVKLVQILKSIHHTNPARILCGISQDLSHMHIVQSFTNFLDSTRIAADRSFDFRIPNVQDIE